jgi:hypothetical protein
LDRLLKPKETSSSFFPHMGWGTIPILASVLSLYIVRMNTIELIWRGLILIILAYFAWSSFVTGSLLAGIFVLLCIPVWLYIGLYNIGYF